MKPFYCRVGNKSKIVKPILIPLIPEHKTYVEPFVGSAALLWGKSPSQIEVINDLDKSLIQDYRLIKQAPSLSSLTIPNLKSIKQFNDFYENAPNTLNNKIIKAQMRRCGGFAGTQSGKIYKFPTMKLKKIDEYKNRFKKVRIFNSSYEKMFELFDSPSTFFYLDPPYEESGRTVKKEYVDIDLEELRDRLMKLKGKWLLSINDSPRIRKLFRQTGIQIKSIVIPASTGEQSPIGAKPRKELLIKNY